MSSHCMTIALYSVGRNACMVYTLFAHVLIKQQLLCDIITILYFFMTNNSIHDINNYSWYQAC